MKPIVTLTLNPAIDESSEAEAVRPTRKVRTWAQRYDPGGGGINVARVVRELGRAALPVFLSGGATGPVLEALLAERGLDPVEPVPIEGSTRVSHSVFERGTGLEYRFVPEGPEVSAEEWRRCLAALERLDFDYLVASGSLPRGLPEDAYAEVARLVARRGGRFVLDTSGPPLAAAVRAGGVALLKPSLGEFQTLIGRKVEEPEAIEDAALALVAEGGVEMLAVTLGHRGALLVTGSSALRLRPPDVAPKSATGAGDSFLGGMVFALAEGHAPEDAFGIGVAAGAAAVLTPGTELCRRDDVWRLYGGLATR
jgi:6-phosphofructokinase 2